MEKDIIELRDMLKKQQSVINNLALRIYKKQEFSVNNNYIQKNLKNFGMENNRTSTPQNIRDICRDLKYETLFELIHCNPVFPENHNIRIKSSKRQLLEIYRNDQWCARPYKDGLEAIILKLNSIFYDYYKNHYNFIKENMSEDKIYKALDKIDDLGKSDYKVKQLKENLLAVLETHRDMLKD